MGKPAEEELVRPPATLVPEGELVWMVVTEDSPRRGRLLRFTPEWAEAWRAAGRARPATAQDLAGQQ